MPWSFATQQFDFGRYSRPVASTFIPALSPWDRLTKDKAFVWVGVASGSVHVSMALLQFNYAGAAVFSVFDARSGDSWSLYRDLPGPLAPIFGPRFRGGASVVSGCVTQADWAGNASVCYDSATEAVHVNASVRLFADEPSQITRQTRGSQTPSVPAVTLSLTYAVDVGRGTFPTLILPLGPRRPVTVSKYAGRVVSSGKLQLTGSGVDGDVLHHDLSGAVASTDFTRGLLRRETVWKWVSLSAVVDGVPYGLHLSTGTYDFGPGGASSESSVFSTGASGVPEFRFLDLPNVTVEQSDTAVQRTESTWHVVGPGGISLTFVPHGGKFHGDIHLGLVDCDLWHMWGTFSGTAPPRAAGGPPLVLTDVPGVLEDHYSLW
jgi:hypothetical protein